MSLTCNENLCPIESIKNTIAFSSRDWASNHRDAWIYGIVHGWDDECMEEMIAKHKWKPETVKRLKRLHKNFNNLKHN